MEDIYENFFEAEVGLPDFLSLLLADYISAKFVAHGYHWNVKGRDFREYHEFFAEIYEDYEGAIDPVAENIRKLGKPAPHLLEEIISISQIHEAPIDGADVEGMLMSLIKLNSVLLETAKKAFDVANELNEQGIANFLAERIDMHQKWNWQLSATLGI
jgi:starvation-inducible DNA-binding protein